jgi:hypothetical protein
VRQTAVDAEVGSERVTLAGRGFVRGFKVGKEVVQLKALFLLVNPVDRPSVDTYGLWEQIASELEPYVSSEFVIERLDMPTEENLSQSLLRHGWDVLHIVTHGHEREASAYSTLALMNAENRSRYLSAKHFAALLSRSLSLKLVVLQAMGNESLMYTALAESFVDNGVPAVIGTTGFRGRLERLFISKLYQGLLAGFSLGRLREQLSNFGEKSDGMPAQVCLRGKDMENPVVPAASGFSEQVVSSGALVSAKTKDPGRPVEAPPAERARGGDSHTSLLSTVERPPESCSLELQRKRDSGIFDVFLSHNSEDKPQVKLLGAELMKAGILPWLDVWELRPGEMWQPALYQQIHNIKSAAVCIGSAGIHRWQEHEINTIFIEFVDRKAPVIPVLLPNAPVNPEVPNFLRTMGWVDFRTSDPPPLDQLIWGITGRRPATRSEITGTP